MRTSMMSMPNSLGLGVRLVPDLVHQLGAIGREHREQRHLAQDLAQGRIEDGVDAAPQDRFGADRLVETQGIDDPIAGEGVDHQPLLIAEDDLLRLGVEIEHPAVDVDGVLDERQLRRAGPGSVTTRLVSPNCSTSACWV